MKHTPPGKTIGDVCAALIDSDAKSAVKYLGSRYVVRATWHNKPSGRNNRETMLVSFGAPNYREAAFIKSCFKAAENLPTKIQLRPWPKKKA